MYKILLLIIFVPLFLNFALAGVVPNIYGTNETNVSDLINEPVKILEKPKPAYPTSNTGTVCIQGTVTLRVQFLAFGIIGKIIPVSTLPYGATENAIEAAKRIRFRPAVKNGLPITVTKLVQFSFTIY